MKLSTDSERARWIAFVQAQALPLEVECKPWRKSRSNEQNALLWAMYEPIAVHMGYDRDDIHEWMCGRFFGWKDIRVPKTPRNPEGLASVPVRSTTRDETAKRKTERETRRETWTAGAELADLFRSMQPRVTYARNDAGEEYGERFEDRCKREGWVACRLYLNGYPK